MAVVGVDFGALHSKIGVARHRGIDIIVNEVSNRATPSLVSFGPKARAIGEPAKTLETSNFRNTVGSLKRLVGRTLQDPEIQQVEKKFTHVTLVDVGGTLGAQVNYLGEQRTFTVTQLVAMYFGKLRDIAANELKAGVTDIVIAVPGWYTDIQRRAVLDAAQIAGLNVLRLINDTTAVALGYGITKSDLPEAENPRHVVFVDVGHSSMSVSVVAFSKGQLAVKSTAYERHVALRDRIRRKYKIDVLSSPKAMFRLAAGCDKVKKVLSANAESPLNVESIMNDVDASGRLTREEYEKLIAPVLDRMTAPLEQALAESGLTLEQVDAVELIGGCTRIPAVRAKIQAVFAGKTLSTTLNQDEAAARGATFACAMLSPVFRVRDFSIHDITPYSIKVQWARQPDDEDTELVVFPHGNLIPSTKVLTFYRKEAFEIEAVYAEPETLPGGINPWVAKFTAKSVGPDENGDVSIVKVKTRLNAHGVMSFEAAYTEHVEEKEVEDSMQVDGEAPKKKRVVKKVDVPFVWGSTSLDTSIVEKYKEQEAQMHAADKLVMDTEERKNALEEYVYDTRGRLDERYAPYVQPQEKEKLLVALQEAEDWLYTEEGEDATKSAYVARLDALKVLGDPITFRYREAEERTKVVSQLRETLNNYMNQATSNDERFSHIDEKDKQTIVEKCATIQKWLEDQTVRQLERPKNVDPVLTSAEVLKKKDEIIYFATPILTKPKPKPKVEPTTPGTETPKSGTETPKKEAPAQENKDGPSEMDENDYDDEDEEMLEAEEDGSASEIEIDILNDDFKTSGKSLRKVYEVEHSSLSQSAVEELMKRDVDYISSVFGVDCPFAALLLRYMDWNKEKLIEKYMDNPVAVSAAAGVSPAEKSPEPSQSSSARLALSAARQPLIGPRRSTRRTPTEQAKSGKNKILERITPPVEEPQVFFCTSCWTTYITSKVRTEAESRISCMAEDCSLVAPDPFIRDALKDDAETWERFQELLVRQFVSCIPHLKFCPYPSCTPDCYMRCSSTHTFCFGCHIDSDHRPVVCGVAKMWLQKCRDDSETANWIKSNTKECSKCQSTIEKNGGCNHMTCKKCKYEFCWVCMGPWSEHGTAWYSCNRFDEKASVEARDMQSKSRASLERYLHYYNRWANHEQSAKLAVELYTKTEKKMEEMQMTSELTWIEVQFMKKGVDIVNKCRMTLKWTYAMAYFLEKGNEKELFEDNQRDLERAVEELSELIESPIEPETIPSLRQKVTDKTVYVQKRNEIMLEDTAKGYLEGRWKWNVAVEGFDSD
ncbi:Heat shock protein hsp88 [Grifola frondosa]|uniref:Heat shock protein hsp88 n=1 Tax=Grifola frondosa TaxID=5627 RepID=A0A1C7M1J6_GRIFR|nr:Heat shock protein hsp88 [Grifola frondosa]